MQIPSADPVALAHSLDVLVDAMASAGIRQPSRGSGSDDRQQVIMALGRLREIVLCGRHLSGTEATEAGEHAGQLLERTARILQPLGDTVLQRQNGLLAVGIALWVGENGGYVERLEPLVDTLAWLANLLTDPEELTELGCVLGRLMEAVSPTVRSNPDSISAGHPWQVLNINRGIVATRTLKPEVMEEAFLSLVKNLPLDAADFFARGMSEMDRVGYPDHVRVVMKKFYDRYNASTSLH